LSYLTLPQLAESPGAQEIAQTAADTHGAAIDSELMERTLRGTDRSAYSAGDIADADAAKARVEQLLAEAAGTIDGYLTPRYATPLASVPLIVATWARAIVRYRLHAHLIVDERAHPIARDYRDALRTLELVSAGKFSLGAADADVAASTDADVRFDNGAKVFGRKFLP